MVKFLSELLRTDVPAAKYCGDCVFIGVGNQLHIYSTQNYKLLKRVVVFRDCNIFGILFTNKTLPIVIFGTSKIKCFDHLFRELSNVSTNDWILCANMIKYNNSDAIATVTMHNVITVWSLKLERIKCVICEEQCISFSSFICNDAWQDLFVLSGTPCSEVLIWRPAEEKNSLAKVLRRLTGHKGVIFSLDFNPKDGLIASTSDDRTCKIWEIKKQPIDATLKLTVSGHKSRIFRCRFLDGSFVTAGEDAIINVWSLNGELLRKLDAVQGNAIWALDYNKTSDRLIVAGADSEVVEFKINYTVERDEFVLRPGCVPKKVALVASGNLVVITELGWFYYYLSETKKLILVRIFMDLKNYVLLEVSKCRTMVALAGFHGKIFIYKTTEEKTIFTHSIDLKNVERLSSFHWLTCMSFLTCESNGILRFCITEKNKARQIANFVLPPSKENCTTAALLIDSTHLVVGDRKGNIYLYVIGHENPMQSLNRAHSHLGVSHLASNGIVLISLGRDGYAKQYNYFKEFGKLTEVGHDKLPLTWLTRFELESGFVLAFLGSNFVIWASQLRRVLFEEDCGGGHRSWDFVSDKESFSFVYLKNKSIHFLKCPVDSILPRCYIKPALGREVNTVCCIPFVDGRVCIFSGGEDTLLRFSTLKNGVLINTTKFKAHLSSIRTLAATEIVEGKKYLLCSGGGRAEIMLWNLYMYENRLEVFAASRHYEQLEKNDSEMRIMDFAFVRGKAIAVLYAACSDGRIQIFVINFFKPHLRRIALLTYGQMCIFKVCSLNILSRDLLVSMASDGKLAFWDMKGLFSGSETDGSDMKPFCTFQVHQSGINSYHYKILDLNYLIFATGGDDNAFVINYLKFIENEKGDIEIERIHYYSCSQTHCAQVSGIYLSNTWLVTASIDQSIALHRWSVRNSKVKVVCENKKRYKTSVPDIHGLYAIDQKNYLFLVVYGKGLEVLKLCL